MSHCYEQHPKRIVISKIKKTKRIHYSMTQTKGAFMKHRCAFLITFFLISFYIPLLSNKLLARDSVTIPVSFSKDCLSKHFSAKPLEMAIFVYFHGWASDYVNNDIKHNVCSGFLNPQDIKGSDFVNISSSVKKEMFFVFNSLTIPQNKSKARYRYKKGMGKNDLSLALTSLDNSTIREISTRLSSVLEVL